MKGEGYLKNVGQFPFASFFHWDNQEELHFVQDGTPPHFAFPLCAWLHSLLPVWCPCWSRTNRMASKRFLFV